MSWKEKIDDLRHRRGFRGEKLIKIQNDMKFENGEPPNVFNEFLSQRFSFRAGIRKAHKFYGNN